jgi:mannobiose 2-epimerase
MNVGEQLNALKDEARSELVDNILPYWMLQMVDESREGFYGRRDGQNNLDENSPKAVILNTRILWTFSRAAREIDVLYLPYADKAYSYIVHKFIDSELGGVFWMVDANGHVLERKKQIYAQAFAIYSFAEYYLSSGNEDSLNRAIGIFRLIEKYSFDPLFNGYLEAFTQDWRGLDDMRLSEKDANEKKTMNTHLHILEAYTTLYRCWPDPELKGKLMNLVTLFNNKFLTRDFHFKLFFNEEWKARDAEISFGHDIEGSWLLADAAVALGDAAWIDRINALAVTMTDVILQEGIDNEGGLIYTPNDSDRHWWPQAEALVGCLNAWQITGDEKYLLSCTRIWEFIQRYIIDTKNGEWFWRVNESGVVYYSEDKAGPWKCPYHNGRAMMEIIKRIS